MTGRDMHTYDRHKPDDSYRDLCHIEQIKAASLAHAVNKLIAKVGQKEKVLVICSVHHMAFGYGMPSTIWKENPGLEEQTIMLHTRKAGLDMDFDRDEFKNNRSRFIQIYGPNAPPSALTFVYEKKKRQKEPSKEVEKKIL